MQNLSLIQKIGFGWFKAIDLNGDYFSFLKSINFFLRLVIYILYITVLTSFVFFLTSFLANAIAASGYPLAKPVFYLAGGILLISGYRFIFVESLMDFNVVELKEMGMQKDEGLFSFGKTHFLKRVTAYIIFYIFFAFMFRIAIFDSMFEDLEHGKIGSEGFESIYLEIISRADFYLASSLFFCAVLYEIYRKRKVTA